MQKQQKTTPQLSAELDEAHRRIEQLQAALAAAELGDDTFSPFFEMSLDLCAIAGFDGYYKRVNSSFERVLGYTVEETLSRPFLEFIHPDDRQAAVEQMQQLLGGCPVVHFVDRNVCKDGSHRWLEWTVTPLPDHQLVYGIGRDITERKAMEQTLRQAGEELERHVEARTSDLALTNERLNSEVEERRRAEVSMREVVAELEQFKTIVSHSPAVVFSASSATNWLVDFASENVQQWGYTVEELTSGQVTWPEIVHPDDQLRLNEEYLEHLTASATAFPQDYRIVTKSGEARFIEVRNQLVYDAQGQPTQIHGIMLDVTDRKSAEKALRSSEERYRALLTGVPDMIFRVAADGTFLDFSPGHGMSPYVPPDRFLGRRIGEVLPADVATLLEPLVKEVAETREMRLCEYRLNIDGQWRDYETRLVLGGRDKVFCIVRDTTDRKRTEQVLQQSLRLASLGTLAAGIAHEINNPVGAALTAAETAQHVFDDPQSHDLVRQCLANVVTSARRCAGIVRSVLKFARHEPHEKKLCKMSTALNNAATHSQEFLWQHQATLTLDVQSDSREVLMNALEIEQVVVNLLHNAAQAKEGPVEILLATQWSDDSVRILVRDNGVGMTDEQKARSFDPFFTTRSDNGGTGLGLSIAYGIVNDHAGSIDVETAVGRGTTISVDLPVGAGRSG